MPPARKVAPPLPRPKRTRPSKVQDRIDARLPSETKHLIEQAAVIIGVSTSDFMVSTAYKAAQDIVSRHAAWALNRAQSKAFVEALLRPPAPNEALRAAAARYKSYQKGDKA